MTKQSIAIHHQQQRRQRIQHRRSFFQLAGHKECFKVGPRPDTILKKSTGNEQECLGALARDPHLCHFAPQVSGTLELEGETYLEMQDLLAGFANVSVMDVKMGYRTYREDELYKALRETQLREDMFHKMVEVDESEPTQEERSQRAVTKPRYMIWRESVSSTASLGFRLEGMRLKDGTIDKDFKTLKEEQQIARTLIRYTKNFETRLRYLRRLYDLKRALARSSFFATHELIGTSLLFVHDDHKAGIWLIDFAKTHRLPEGARVDHLNKWELGNHEDGYLAGVENLIRILESITRNNHPQQQQPPPLPQYQQAVTTIAMAPSVIVATTKAAANVSATATQITKPTSGLEYNNSINNNNNSSSSNNNKQGDRNSSKSTPNGCASVPSPMKHLGIRTI